MAHGLRLVDPEPRARLPFGAARVLKAVAHPALSWLVKAVWLELYALHNGPEGAYIGATPLARRLGISREGVEKARRQLKALGLLWDLKVEGRRTSSWFPTLPASCLPTTHRPTDPEVLDCAGRLRQLLDQTLPAPSGTPVENQSVYPGTPVDEVAASPQPAPSSTPVGPLRQESSTGVLPGASADPTGVPDATALRRTGARQDAGSPPTGVLPGAPEEGLQPQIVRENLQPPEVGGSVEPPETLELRTCWRDTFRQAVEERARG